MAKPPRVPHNIPGVKAMPTLEMGFLLHIVILECRSRLPKELRKFNTHFFYGNELSKNRQSSGIMQDSGSIQTRGVARAKKVEGA